MKIKKVSINNLAQHKNNSFKLSKNITTILAGNGTGKTTFTQSIVNSDDYDVNKLIKDDTQVNFIGEDGVSKNFINKIKHLDEKRKFVPKFTTFSDFDIITDLLTHTNGKPLLNISKEKNLLDSLIIIKKSREKIKMLSNICISGIIIPKQYRDALLEKDIQIGITKIKKALNKKANDNLFDKTTPTTRAQIRFIFDILEFRKVDFNHSSFNRIDDKFRGSFKKILKTVDENFDLRKYKNWVQWWLVIQQENNPLLLLEEKYQDDIRDLRMSNRIFWFKIRRKLMVDEDDLWLDEEIKKTKTNYKNALKKSKKLIKELNSILSKTPLRNKIIIDLDLNIIKNNESVIISTGELKLILIIKFLLELQKDSIVIFDDIFTSLDFGNLDFVIRIIKDKIGEKNCQAIILTHSDLVFWNIANSLKPKWEKNRTIEDRKIFDSKYKFLRWYLFNDEVLSHEIDIKIAMGGKIKEITNNISNNSLPIDLRLNSCRKLLEYLASFASDKIYMNGVLNDSIKNPKISILGKIWTLNMNVYPYLNKASHFDSFYSIMDSQTSMDKQNVLNEMIRVFKEMKLIKK